MNMVVMFHYLPKTGLLLSLVASLVSGLAFPLPNGQYGVDVSTMELVDQSRLDPYAPTPQPRRLMVSTFYPTGVAQECQPYLSPYMPTLTAAIHDQFFSSMGIPVPNGTFEALELSLCFSDAASDWSRNKWPVVLFSPGLTGSRLIYSALAQEVASRGYVVITIDHPYDALVVEYPDGSTAMATNITTDDQITADVAVRAEDVSFVIDSLEALVWNDLPWEAVTCPYSGHTQVLMYGHSLGGATAAATMMNDSRIIGGINLDGSFYGPVVEAGLDSPFLIWGNQGANTSTIPNWATIWPNLRSSKIELSLAGSEHFTFLDLPLLVQIEQAVGAFNISPALLAGLIGVVPGIRVMEILPTYIDAFFQFVLGSTPAPILLGPSTSFPEVVYIQSNL